MDKRSTTQKQIGQRLRILRQALRLSQKEFGQQLAVSGCYLSMVENGLRQPSEHLLRLLCLTQNVNRQWLERGVGEMLCRPAGGRDAFRASLLPYNRTLMKMAMNLVAQALGEMDRNFSAEDHCDVILNCYEKLVLEESGRRTHSGSERRQQRSF